MRYLFALFLLLCAMPARAEDVSNLFCPALQDEKSYKGTFQAYAKMIAGEDGWVFRTDKDLDNKFNVHSTNLVRLLKFQAALQKRGVELVIMYPPTRGMVHAEYTDYPEADKMWTEYSTEISKLQAKGLHIVGLGRPPQGSSFFYKRDHHWNKTGAKLSAQALAAYVKTLPVYESLKKTKFVTKPGEALEYEGVFNNIFEKYCHTTLPPESVVPDITEPADTASSADDLFGDIAEPEVVLVGTSNSVADVHANFDGALKQNLSTDVMNVALAGAGIDHPMFDYLNSDHFKTGKAKLIVWEVPGYYDLDRLRRFLRQGIPQAVGDCKTPLAEAEVTLDDGKQTILPDLKDKDFGGENYYLTLHFDNPVSHEFVGVFDYPELHDEYEFKYSDRAGAQNDFYASLRINKSSPVLKIGLDVPPSMAGMKVTAHICKM